MSILDKFLEIENNEELYKYTFSYKDVLIYPFIRFHLLQSSNEDELSVNSPYDPFHISITNKIRYIFRSFLYRPHKSKQSDIVFFGSDISNIRLGNSYFNRLTESFANEYKSKTILIEISNKMDYKRPRTYSKVFSKDILNIFANYRAKLVSLTLKDINEINDFLQYLQNHFNHKFKSEKFWNEMKKTLIESAKKLPFLYKGYVKLLKKLSPKIILLDCACYGSDNIPLIMAAKYLNIPIGEYQHGLISLTHPAYNYSVQLPDKYKTYMPDFYMSYGKYWIKNSRIPIKTLEVGNPHLSDTISQYREITKKECILYISSAITPERYTDDVITLNKNLLNTNCSVIFRTHPSETPRLSTVYKPIIDSGIPIDTQPLYETLKSVKYIIGDYSTVLFEAIVFDCIIFVKDTKLNRENIDISQFNIVRSMEDLIEKINLKNYKKTNSDIFWADNWRTKYHQIIDAYVKMNNRNKTIPESTIEIKKKIYGNSK